MELKVERKYRKEDYTIGNLYVNGKYFCNTLEDKDRGLSKTMSLLEINRKKVMHKTAIPTGKYTVSLNVVSPKYSTVQFYKEFANNSKVPRLLNTPGFEGILIHCGNDANDSSGCILIGENKAKGKILNSKETFKKLYPILLEASKKGEVINITIE